MSPEVYLLNVFAAEPGGGNPAPIVLDAAGMSDAEMQAVAARYGHESGFAFPAPAGSDADVTFRFWVPRHEMEMCGHVTVGAVWLMDRLGRLASDRLTIQTVSGRVEARIRREGGEASVEISQPNGEVDPVSESDAAVVRSVLGVSADQMAVLPIQNARTSRVKTLVPLASAAILDGLTPDFSRVEAACERIGSTGLYPYAVSDAANQVFDARQFPKSSGYPEDAATGIAAAALAFGLLQTESVRHGSTVRVRQGRAMGRPSAITVRFRLDPGGETIGCWLGGQVQIEEGASHG
jgi:PhzF family phenazine biosynthesis protein